MRRKFVYLRPTTVGMFTGALVASSALFVSSAPLSVHAQEGQSSSTQQSRSQSSTESEKQSRNNQPQSQSDDSRNRQRENASNNEEEIRLRYNDEKNRLNIDVDESIQFNDNSQKRDTIRDGQFDLRYDTDENNLTTSGQATVDMDRAASQLGRWWQSWWDDERQSRIDRDTGSRQGALVFIQQYDDNDDNYLTREELPPHMRNDFQTLDRDNDRRVSRTELFNFGQDYFDIRSRQQRYTSQQDRSQRSGSMANNDEDRTWSQWWSSWWSEDQSGRSQQESAASGATRLISLYDENDDGFLDQQELPNRMRSEFAYVDRNNDGYLSRMELRNYGYALRSTSQSADTERTAQTSGQTRRQTTQGSSANNSDQSQSWSQWWSSFMSDNQGEQTLTQMTRAGVERFLRENDENDDGVIVRSEMPRSMYDEFQRIDTNDDRRLTRTELTQYAAQSLDRDTSTARASSSTTQNRSATYSAPASVAYGWYQATRQGQLQRNELQSAYELLQQVDLDGNGVISQSELDRQSNQTVARWYNNYNQRRSSSASRSSAGTNTSR